MNTQTLGKYQLKKHIATGGMAEIWLAEQSGPGGFQRELVIKRILPHLAADPEFIQMFLDEARLVAQLNHPQIAQIYELGQVDGAYFIAMEFIDGIDVSQLIEFARASGSFIPLNMAYKIINDVLLALDYAHEFKDKSGNLIHLVHRDISPQNVLVSNDGVVKLVDFGVAKAVINHSKTQPGGVKGKFSYMAPEQIQSSNVDRRADLFAVGLLFYEILTLQKPFGEDLQAVTGIISLPTPNAGMLRSEIPKNILEIINHMLEKDPDARYQDANAIYRDISNNLLAAGGMVTDRDVSSYVRNLRGLPTYRTSKTDIQNPNRPKLNTDIPEIKTPLPVYPATGPEDAIAFASGGHPVTASISVSKPVQGLELSESLNIVHEEPKNTGLVVAMLVITGLIVVLGIGVVYWLIQQSETLVKDPPVHKVPILNNIKVEKKLHHADGLPVFLVTEPSTNLSYDGAVLGRTPFETTLRPGKYTLAFDFNGKKVVKTIHVKPGKLIQRFKFKF